jgi:hypothetical protein
MKPKFHLITVEGSGPFPIDMLRNNQCWPYETDDSALVQGCNDRMRIVRVKGTLTPNTKRWESFGWRVRESQKTF